MHPLQPSTHLEPMCILEMHGGKSPAEVLSSDLARCCTQCTDGTKHGIDDVEILEIFRDSGSRGSYGLFRKSPKFHNNKSPARAKNPYTARANELWYAKDGA